MPDTDPLYIRVNSGGGGGGPPPVAETISLCHGEQWSNMPAAGAVSAPWDGDGFPCMVDLSQATEYRATLSVKNAGPALAACAAGIQHSPDGAIWTDLFIENLFNIGGGLALVTPWTAIPAAMQADVFLRVVGQGGDGAADPSISMRASFR
jgi:hypothetical protein